MTLEGRHILVTGGAGAIGSRLVPALLAAGAAGVTVLDDLSSGRRENLPADPRGRLVEGDVRDEAALDRAFAAPVPSVVFHLAAQFANQNSVDHPVSDLETNAGGTIRLLERARAHGVGRFLYVSSSCVYEPSAEPLDDRLPPVATDTPYAVSKGVAERYCLFYARQYGVPVTIARLFNSYGPGELPGPYRNVVPNFIATALRGEPLPVMGTGEERRSFTYVDDVVAALRGLAEKDEAVGDVVNVGSGVEVAIRDLAAAVNRLTGNAAGTVAVPRRSWDHVTVRRPALGKLEAYLGEVPATPLEEGLRATVDWLVARRSAWDA